MNYLLTYNQASVVVVNKLCIYIAKLVNEIRQFLFLFVGILLAHVGEKRLFYTYAVNIYKVIDETSYNCAF